MAKLFLSHSSADKEFVRKLADDLISLGHQIWFDEWKIMVGDSIISELSVGIDEADFVILIVSSKSTKSRWVEVEWQAKYWQEITHRQIRVLPAVIDQCTIPVLLRPKLYADFRESYMKGLIQLALALHARSDTSGVQRYFNDFVEITDEWISLFERSTQLDLLIMYSSTWRNTYHKNIVQLLERPQARIRVVIPSITDNKALQLLAGKCGYEEGELKSRIQDTVSAFSQLATKGAVEIYTTTRYLTQACYLFDSSGVLALYSYQLDRVPTPAFLLGEGALLTFLRKDFDWLTSALNSDRQCLLASGRI